MDMDLRPKLDPRILVNQSINGILETMRYYVDENPYKINFSPAFINAFRGLLDVDNDLMGEQFEKILMNFKTAKDELLTLKMNLFKLQLHIILKRKVIIERECPDDPNIKDIINLFNRKIEALLKIMHSQYEMEGDENNPLNNSFIELRDKKSNNLKDAMNKHAQNIRIANDRISAIRLSIDQKNSKKELTIQRLMFFKNCQEIVNIIKTNYSITVDDYSSVLITLEEEIEALKVSINKDINEINEIEMTIQTYEPQKNEAIENLMHFITEEIETLKEKKETIEKEHQVIKDQFEFQHVTNEYNRLEAGELDCDKEISEMYINLFGRYTTLLDNLMDVNVNYNTKKDLLDFLSKEKNISENDFDSIEQINKSRHKTNFINDLLQEMNYFKTAWNTQPFKQISVVLFQLFEALVTKYEEQLKNVSIYVQAPISTSNDKITNESKYLCDLDVLKTKIATNDAQLDSKTKLLHTTDEYYMNIQNKIISLYQQISSMNGLDFTELLSSLKKKEIESFESRINLKNQILTLLQEKETMKTREQFIQVNQQIRTETSFGLAVSSIEIYDLYKQVYNSFHLPVTFS